MRRMPLAILLLLSLFYYSSTLITPAASAATISTEGAAWSEARITVVIVPPENVQWFRAGYSSDVRRAVERWADAITVYTDLYGSGYLRQLYFDVYTIGLNQSSADIEISFVQSNATFVGVTEFFILTNGTFQTPVRMRLAAFDSQNRSQLTDIDMTNIAAHEFGHAIGLGHASTALTDDGALELMFTEYRLPIGSPANLLLAPSTLDVYALSYIYDWLANSATLTTGRPPTSLSLPPGIAYSSLVSYSKQIEALKKGMEQLNLRILVLATVTMVLLAISLTLGILLLKGRTPIPSEPQQAEPPEAIV